MVAVTHPFRKVRKGRGSLAGPPLSPMIPVIRRRKDRRHSHRFFHSEEIRRHKRKANPISPASSPITSLMSRQTSKKCFTARALPEPLPRLYQKHFPRAGIILRKTKPACAEAVEVRTCLWRRKETTVGGLPTLPMISVAHPFRKVREKDGAASL
jgi:hypothetical protein